MRNLKRVLSLALALVMMLGMMIITSSAAGTTVDFADADEITNTEAVDVMVALGVIEGDGTNFNPNDILTREQAAKIICYMLMGPENAEKLSKNSSIFVDVAAGRWSAGYIAYCANLGYIAGYGDGNFGPEDELTAVAFGKLLLVALGYDPEIEGYVGSNWATNIATDMIDAGIDAKGVALDAPLSRDDACQMALQTLTATMVDYTGGTNITTGDGTSIIVDANLYKVGSSVEPVSSSYANVATPYTQFCEKYFKDLAQNTTTSTSDGRPAYAWTYGATAVGSYNYAPTFVWTSEMKTPAVTSALRGYTAAVADAKIVDNNKVTATSYTNSSVTTLNIGNIAGQTGNGVVVEVYTDGAEVTDIVTLTTTVASVSRIVTTAGKEAVVLDNGCTIEKKANGSNYKFYDVVKDLKAGDPVLTIVDGAVSTTLIDVAIPDVVTGTLSKVDNDAKAYTVDGTVYSANKAFSVVTTNLGSTVDLTLDTYGYVIAEAANTGTAQNVAYVLETSRDGSAKLGYTFSAKLLFTDGTVEWVEVSKLNNKAYGDAGNSFVADFVTTPYINKFVMYNELDDGTYSVSKTLTTGYTQVGLTTGDDIVNGTSAIASGVNGSNATIFLLQNRDGSFTVYTGIKKVPDVTMGATGGQAFVKSTYASVIVVTTGTITKDDADLVLIYDTTPASSAKVGATTVNYYKAIVNGEITTVGVDDAADDSIAVALYVDSTYTGSYISTLGSAYAASSDTDTAVVVVDNPASVTLVNGILTAGSDYVVDDGFVAYDIDLAATPDFIAGLNLTAVANTDYSHSGDLAILVYDADGVYISCAFFINNANA